jgi:hypothetical protein
MSDLHRQRRARNLALGGALLALVVLFFFLALVKFGGAG